MRTPNPPIVRKLGTPTPPRRRFVAPTAVRFAEASLLFRVAFGLGLVLLATTQSAPAGFTLTGFGRITLPSSAMWNALAPWAVGCAVVESALVLRLDRLRSGSRHVVLLLESAAIVVSGMYAAAGLKVALVPLVAAIATVVLLRLDRVRHSFEVAGVARRRQWQAIPGVLYDGYAPVDPLARKEIQRIGYRVSVEAQLAAARSAEMSKA